MLKTFTLATRSALPRRGGRFLTKHEGKAISSRKTHHRTFACFLCVQSTGSRHFPWQPGALPCPALPCPASSPGGSSRHLGQPMEKRSPCPAQGKALDIIGQKTTFGKETRQKEWEQARKRLPSSAWQEVPSPALAMGCHRDWESSGMLTPAQKLPVQPREEHFKTTNCTWKEHWQGAGKKHAPPSWRSTRSFL